MKNLRIVLLAVTAVLSVFSFATMLAVRPGQQSAVLDAARQRQEEPILSVAEPLETDTDAIAEEERIARMAADILADDEEFITRISSEVETSVPGYIAEYVQSDEFKALFEASVEESIDEIVSRVISELVTDENLDYVASIVAEKLGTSEDEVYVAAFSRIASHVLSMITLPDDDTLDIEKAVMSVYEARRDEFAEDVIAAAIMNYNDLSTEEKIELLSTDKQAAAIYADEHEYIISDIVSSIVDEYNALTVEEKIDALSTDEQVEALYPEYREYRTALGAALAWRQVH